MNAEIINIGDELLIGQVVNTNAAKMSQYLNDIGIKVNQVKIIADVQNAITTAIECAMKQADVVLLTGGLGPTKDDITKTVLCQYFNTRLVFSEEAYQEVEAIFARTRRTVTETNKQQAFVPESCTQIPNKNGTARGMWFEKDGRILISMPGVPFEMTAMMENYVIPWLQKHTGSTHIIHKTLMIQGIGESFLSDTIEDWELSLPSCIRLAYLPQPGLIRLRLTAQGHDKELLEKMLAEEIKTLKEIVPEYIFAEQDTTMQQVIFDLLTQNGKTVSFAESCTGGYIAHLLTSISGSSACFKGSMVTYANEIKSQVLQVSEHDLKEYGAVSEAVVRQMAENIRLQMKTDYAIATSGIAGPQGGTTEKPVGTIWIAVSNGKETQARCFHFNGDRIRNIQRGTIAALNMLREMILADYFVH